MNVLPPYRIARIEELLRSGEGVRATAREAPADRKAVANYRRKWIEKELQRAYDAMCEGEGELCDEITAPLPEKEVCEMLDAWVDDQDGKEPRSKWY